MADKRYFSEDDPETGITREQLADLSAGDQRPYLLDWFGRNFEDPAQERPYNGREGGYQFIAGGPYDAREELWSEFEGVASEDLIDEVADEVESDGITDWALGAEHSDQVAAFAGNDDHEEGPESPQLPIGQAFLTDNDGAYITDSDGSFITTTIEPNLDDIAQALAGGLEARFGGPADLEERRKLFERIADLEGELDALQPTHGGIGHNNPPADDTAPEPTTLPATIIDAASDAIAVVKTELAKDQPNAVAIARASGLLQKFGHWCAGKGDTFADEFAKAFGKSLGTASGIALPLAAAGLATALGGYLHTVIVWFRAISWPF